MTIKETLLLMHMVTVVAGCIRSTLLYLGMTYAVKEHSFKLLFMYSIMLAIPVVLRKLSKDHIPMEDSLFYGITHDILAPILGLKSLVKLLRHKYLDSPNEPHAEIFLAQGITEAVWSVLFLIYLVIIVL